MLEQVLVWIIVAIAAAYAVRAIVRSFRKSSDHCSNCGISEGKDGPRSRS
jgi:membrane protein implicated in regulation of membrane protease activity